MVGPPERKKKPYCKYATGKIVVKAQCPNGHVWEMDYTPPPKEKVVALICENISDGRVLTKILTEQGWQVVSAQQGEHMLETGRAQHFSSRKLAEEWLAARKKIMSDECRELHTQLIKARAKVQEIEKCLRRKVREFLPAKDNELTFLLDDLYIGDVWDCPQSPTGHCVYDRYKDPARDDCLFCHEPSERK